MTPGHKDAQDIFIEIGGFRGYQTARSFNVEMPTDGVWLVGHSFGPINTLPLAALEVAASESPKTWRGSIATLEEVSPTFGILLLQEEVRRRRLSANGWEIQRIEEEIARILAAMREAVSKTKQRIIVMTMSQLRYQHRIHHVAYSR